MSLGLIQCRFVNKFSFKKKLLNVRLCPGMHDIFNYSLKATKIVVELITHANLIFFLSKHIAHE